MATILGIVLSGVLILTASRAAFSAQTANSGNSFETGDVVLTDDDADAAMFTVTNMSPGDTEVACIAVTYEGSIEDPDEVRLFSGGFDDDGTLGAELDLTVEIGSGGDFSTCTGFTPSATIFATDALTTFDASHTDYVSAVTGWDPASTPETRTFRFTVELPDTASNAVQGNTVSNLEFVWEVQS